MREPSNGMARSAAGTPAPSWFARNAKGLLAAIVIAGLWIAMQPERVGARQRSEAAHRFRLERVAMPEIGAGPYTYEREVQPFLKHFVAWMSAVGAAVAINDLDDDGLANDLCHIDARTDQVMVAPAPRTGDRYAPYLLDPAPLRFDKRTMKPFGCVPGDFNEDGATDVMVYYNGRTPVIFLRDGTRLVPIELVSGEERWFTAAITVADIDGDGHQDLLVANYFPNGAQIFDVEAESDQEMQRSFSRAFNGGHKHILLWRSASSGSSPSVTYQEATGVLDPEVNDGWSLALAAQDLDGDLLPEIYIANDFGPDRLLHNRSTPGKVVLEVLEGEASIDSVHSKIVGRDSFKGMGVDCGDLNGDAIPDLMISNIAARYALIENHLVFVSTGDLAAMQRGVAPYVDRGNPLGLSRNSWAWDLKFADLDNDGSLEVLQALGFLKGETNRWPELQELGTANDELLSRSKTWPRLERGDEVSGHEWFPIMTRLGERYIDIAPELGLDQVQVSRGVGTSDIDGDGDIDFAVANQWEPSSFYVNHCMDRGSCGAFLGLHLDVALVPGETGEAGAIAAQPGHAAIAAGRPAIGAAVKAHLPDGRVLVAQVDGGNGGAGRRSFDLHFGLGAIDREQELPIEIAYRDPVGRIRHEKIRLKPGWHSVLLGWSRDGNGGDR